jgi:hypothetical protein
MNKKDLTTDIEAAKKVLEKKFNFHSMEAEELKGNIYTFPDFQSLFAQALFKETLFEVLHTIEKENKEGNPEMNEMSLQI